MATFGDTAIEASTIGLSAGNYWAFKFSLLEDGLVTAMQVYCNPPGGAEQANLGLYSDSSNSPNILLGSTGNFVLASGASWNVASLTSAYSAVAGTYWLAVLAPTGFGGIDNLAYHAASGVSWFVSGVGASLPNPRSGGSLGTDLISIYATYTPTASSSIPNLVMAPYIATSAG